MNAVLPDFGAQGDAVELEGGEKRECLLEDERMPAMGWALSEQVQQAVEGPLARWAAATCTQDGVTVARARLRGRRKEE